MHIDRFPCVVLCRCRVRHRFGGVPASVPGAESKPKVSSAVDRSSTAEEVAAWFEGSGLPSGLRRRLRDMFVHFGAKTARWGNLANAMQDRAPFGARQKRGQYENPFESELVLDDCFLG